MPSIDEISQQSMMNALKQLDVVSNNLANSSTPGFKSESVYFNRFDNLVAAQMQNASLTDGVLPAAKILSNFSEGSLQRTGNPLDFAIDGDAFFELQSGAERFYSRAGGFSLASDGRLVNSSGLIVSGVDGDIYLQGGDVSVDRDGAVFEEGEEVGQLKLVKFASTSGLERAGKGLWRTPAGASQEIDDQSGVFQGYLEASNVEPVKEMTNMMMIMRQFESQSRALKEYDGMMNSAISTIADF